MKILTGSLRGREISFKPNPHLRPTVDKVRKAIMDSLQAEIAGRRVLDAFAGTGALGFEALSCGAASAVFIEKDASQAKKIRENLFELGLESRGKVLQGDAFKAAERLSRSGETFDLIFLDPPYAKALAVEMINSLSKHGLMAQEALVVWECGKHEAMRERIGPLTLIKQKKYGDTLISYLRH